jgi:MULE transposase domain/MuDR family transposase
MGTDSPNLAIGATFPTSQSLKDACREYAIKEFFEYQLLKSNKARYTIACKINDCPWRLHASQIEKSSIFRIKTYHHEHTCRGINGTGHRQATQSFVAHHISEKLKEQPSLRPCDIVRDIQRDFHVNITYSKAYRAKEVEAEQIHGTHEEAYQQLRKYCEDIERTNPNSTAMLDVTLENKFKRIFICYGASAVGFPHCMPILGLDGTHLKHKYKGILLAATAVDGMGQLFPYAYAIVDVENNDNWLWCLQLLQPIVAKHAPQFLQTGSLVLLSDRQKGFLQGVQSAFPDCPHSYCLAHLERNMHKKFKNTELKALLWQAARATTVEAFDKALEDMKNTEPGSVDWLLETADPEHWAELFFEGQRYGHLTSNISESLNNWLENARQLPILALLEDIRHKMQGMYSVRTDPGPLGQTAGLGHFVTEGCENPEA